MAWVTISPGDLVAGQPWTAGKAAAVYGNVAELAAGSDGSPINQGDWHPFDAVTYGDGADGAFFDHAVDGSINSKESAAWADGYEYALRFAGLALTNRVNIDLYRDTTGSFQTAFQLLDSAGAVCNGWMAFRFPRQAAETFVAEGAVRFDNAATNGLVNWSGQVFAITGGSQTLGRVRVAGASGVNLTAGTVALYRRRIAY